MKKEIIKIAKEEKISDIGFCSAREYDERINAVADADLYGTRNTIKTVQEGAQTVIVCAFNYFNGAKKGNVSRYAQGLDYHLVTKAKMKPIADYLEKAGYKAEMFSDIGKLNERLLAFLSGIAFPGKNQMAISPKFGSYFFIGYILTDCVLGADEEQKKKCVGCGKCIEACPLGALKNGFEQKLCLSYITQKKEELTDKEKDALVGTNNAWGCDICQEVCPHNINVPITDIDEFKNDLIIDLDVGTDLSNREFKEKYGNRAFSWRGKGVLKRNQDIFEKN